MDELLMKKAYMLAKRGIGFTSPNPCVGAVIVKKGIVIGSGWHKKAGSDHAELIAIKSVKNKTSLKGSSMYVTLEPCCHVGKTPPCVSAILEYGISSVFIGMIDPFDKVRGNGVRFLKENGVRVEILPEDASLARNIRSLNQPFLKAVKYKLPYVTLKAGISLDGKIATHTGNSKWITGEDSRNDSKIERCKYDCVVVGAGTVDKDDPLLALNKEYENKRLLRVLIDKSLSSDVNKKVFRDDNVFVATTKMASKADRDRFSKRSIEFKIFGKDSVSIKDLLKYLAGRGLQSVFVEGGSGVHGSFHDAMIKDKNLVDKVIFYIAPKLIGGEKALTVIGGTGIQFMDKVRKFSEYDMEKIGGDFKFTGVFNLY